MTTLIELKTFKDKKLEKDCNKIINELIDFYEGSKLKFLPGIFFVPDRKTIDEIRKEKTESWLTGWFDSGNIYILNRDNFEKESNHKYLDETYLALIKHELSHIFFSRLSKGKNKPVWLMEGVAIFSSGQLKFKKKPEKFTNFLSFGEKGGKGVYEESGFVIELLFKKFGKNKLLELIKRLSEVNSEESFNKLFTEIYGFKLSYNSINK